MFEKGEVDLTDRKNSVWTSIDVVSEDVAVGEHPSHNLRRTKNRSSEIAENDCELTVRQMLLNTTAIAGGGVRKMIWPNGEYYLTS